MSTVAPFLKKVHLASDVYAICLQHAFTTEKQEVMGLLIGEVDEENGISRISACKILHRSDKQPDRVEISPEQLCTASAHADLLTEQLNRPMRVLGWYHSHPHITVWPSHVDVQTQAMYQIMDALFVGLIFSVYASDSGSVGNTVQVTCFQATGTGANMQRREVELVIDKSPLQTYNLEEITNLSNILIQEEMDSHKEENCDILTQVHNDALKTLSIGHIVSSISIPTLEALQARLAVTNSRIKELEKLKEKLTSSV